MYKDFQSNLPLGIQNKDDICLTRDFVVSIAKLENDVQYKSIVDSRRPLQSDLAYELHEKASVSIGSCGLAE